TARRPHPPARLAHPLPLALLAETLPRRETVRRYREVRRSAPRLPALRPNPATKNHYQRARRVDRSEVSTREVLPTEKISDPGNLLREQTHHTPHANRCSENFLYR